MSTIEASLRLEISDYQTNLAKAKNEAGKLRADLERKSAGIEQAVLGRTEKYRALAESARAQVKAIREEMAQVKITPDWGIQKADMAGFRASMASEGVSGGNMLRMGMSRGLLMAGGLTAVGAAAIAGLRKSVKLAQADESLSIRLKVLVGDSDKANQLKSELKNLAAKTPLEFPELANAGKLLVSFGEDVEQVPQTLARIGDISQGVGAPIGEIAELYGKARVQGTLFAEDINQLTGRGIPVIQEFARIMGVNEGQVKKLASEGQITFPLLEAAFISLTAEGGKFSGMMKEVAKSGEGLESTVKDELGGIVTEFGKPIASAWKGGLEELLPILGSIKREIRIIQGDASVFSEERAAAASPEAAAKAAAEAKKKQAEIEAKAREQVNARIADQESLAQAKNAEKKAKEREVELKHVKSLRDEVSGLSEGMLPDADRLAILQRQLGDLFFDAQLTSGKSFQPSIDALRQVVESMRAAGNISGEASALSNLRQALQIQRELDSLQEKMREHSASQAADRQKEIMALKEKQKQEAEANAEKLKAEFKVAQEKQKQDAEEAAHIKQIRDDYIAENEILKVRVNGEEAKADAMQRSLDIMREARDLQESMKLSEEESLKLAQQRSDLQQRLKDQEEAAAKAKENSRYDENGRRKTDGRKQINAHIDPQKSRENGFGGLDQFYKNQQTPLRDTFKTPLLDQYNQKQQTPLRDEFKFPGLDAYDALQKKPTGDRAERNAAAETRNPQDNATQVTQMLIQTVPQILAKLSV